MKKIFKIIISVVLTFTITNCNGQIKTKKNQNDIKNDKVKIVGGGCDGCELMYVGMPENIKSIDTSSGWIEKGQKLLLTGTVYKLGGKIPAPDVIIYYWHTDSNGYYSPKEEVNEQAKRHGHIRGWVKSDKNGRYSIYTIRPAPYPNNLIPAHIHTSIKEPNIDDEYYLDEFVFDDDVLFTNKNGKELDNRGGSGVLNVSKDNDMQVAKHDIILGLNIPNYPKKNEK